MLLTVLGVYGIDPGPPGQSCHATSRRQICDTLDSENFFLKSSPCQQLASHRHLLDLKGHSFPPLFYSFGLNAHNFLVHILPNAWNCISSFLAPSSLSSYIELRWIWPKKASPVDLFPNPLESYWPPSTLSWNKISKVGHHSSC